MESHSAVNFPITWEEGADSLGFQCSADGPAVAPPRTMANLDDPFAEMVVFDGAEAPLFGDGEDSPGGSHMDGLAPPEEDHPALAEEPWRRADQSFPHEHSKTCPKTCQDSSQNLLQKIQNL